MFGESAAVAITSQAEALGIGIVTYEAFQPGLFASAMEIDPNLRASRSARIRAAKPDVIFLVSNHVDDALNLLKLVRTEGLQPQLFVGVAGAFVSPDFLEKAGDEIENLVVTAQWSADVDRCETGHNESAHFVAQFEARYGRTPGMRSAQSYTALFVAKEALEMAGNTVQSMFLGKKVAHSSTVHG